MTWQREASRIEPPKSSPPDPPTTCIWPSASLLPISLSRPPLWAFIPSSPPTQRHCSCNCFSLLSSHFPPLHWICSNIMKICYYSSLLYKQQSQNSSFLTLFPLSRYCQFFPLIFEAKLLQRSIFMVSNPPPLLFL